MREATSTFASHDGLTLVETSWIPTGTERGVVAILHGGGEHARRYRHVAERFVAAGWRVDAFDQRSHGRSERVRGVPLQCDDVEHLLVDTERWLRTRADEGLLFVVAHSMGALVATSLACADRLPVDGLVTLGAALHITPDALIDRAVEIALDNPDAPVAAMGRGGFDASTRDVAMKRAIADDPVHADVTGVPAQLLATTGRHGPTLRDSYDRIRLPLLVMHGTADLMADPAASIELAAGASTADVTLELVDGGYHALLRDLDREHVMTTILDWLALRSLGRGPTRNRTTAPEDDEGPAVGGAFAHTWRARRESNPQPSDP